MLENQKTAELVKKEIENDLYLLEVLKEGLVNHTALAKKLLPSIKKNNPKATTESVSVAIKRFLVKESSKKQTLVSQRIISNSQLSTKNDVISKTFSRNEFVLNKIVEVSKKIEWNRDEILFINQGFGEVTVVLDKKNEYYFDDCKNELIIEKNDLAILSIKEIFENELDKSIDVIGIYSYFINQLSKKSINIIEIISTFSQLTLILKSDDLMKAYSIIDESIRYFRNKDN